MNESKWLVNCDWLTLNYHTAIAYSAEEISRYLEKVFVCKIQPYSTRHFKSVISVEYPQSYLNVSALEIVCTPLSKILHPCLLQVKIANIALYNGAAYYYIKKFEECLCAKYIGISRIDVCVDSDFQDIKNLTDGLRNRTILMKGNKKVQEYYSIDRKKGIDYEGVKFGSAVSAYTFKIYNKTKEIQEESQKYYILDYWKENGLAEDAEIFRYEFSILDLDKIELSNGANVDGRELLRDSNILLEILEYYRLKIKCVKVEAGYFEKTPEEKQFIRFTDDKEYKILPNFGISIPKKIDSQRVGSKTRTAKACISMNLDSCLDGSLNKYEAYNLLQSIFVIANRLHLNDWLKMKKWEDLHNIYALYSNFVSVRTGDIVFKDLFQTDWVLTKRDIFGKRS